MLKNFIQKLFKHKKTAWFIIILILILAYLGIKSLSGGKSQPHYALSTVSKGTLITSVSGTGQVSASNQVDIKAKVSGDVVYVNTAALGQSVKSGALLVQLDSSDAQKAVRDAQANLESAQLALEKLQQPVDRLSLLQAENALTQAQENKQNAQDALEKAYNDGFNSVANAFIDLPGIMSGLHDAFYNYTLNPTEQDIDYYTNAVQQYDSSVVVYRNSADSAYQTARTSYDQSFNDYKLTTHLSDTATIESLINETYNTTKYISEALKDGNNLIQFYKDQLSEHNLSPVALANTQLNNLNTYTSKTTTHLSDLLSMETTLQNDKQNINDADRSIAEKQASLDKLNAGTDPLDLQSQELSLKQRQNSLTDAQETLADCYIRAPFDGTLAKLDFQKGDAVSSGTAIATLITPQRLAAISLNEVDIAKIKVGQPVTLTFDAIDGLSIAGQVAEVDTLGAVSQGVVTYGVQISFDTQDDRVKPGMSVSTAIVTNAEQNALMVPNSAIKTSGSVSYVLVPAEKQPDASLNNNSGVVLATTPKQQVVQVGLSNDSYTEITSGLQEGDQIITKTIASSTKSTTTTGQSLLQVGGAARGGGGFIGR